MKARHIILIPSLFTLGVCTILALYIISDKVNHQRNNFIRLFPPHPVLPSSQYDIKYNSYYIAGGTSNYIYLGNVSAPLHLIKMNNILTDTQHVSLSMRRVTSSLSKSLLVTIDSPYFYMLDRTTHIVFRGTLDSLEATEYLRDTTMFSEILPISSTSFASRALTSKTYQNILAKGTTTKNQKVKTAPNILERQIDGLFCTDGMFHYSDRLNRLVYIYYYRNQFICLDTNLNILTKGQTIDTVSRAKIKVANLQSNSKKTLTMSAPPLTVNRESCVYGHWLFVNSNLLAKNENQKLFDKASVIDVYDLTSNSYKFSFYLFDYGGKKMQSFRIVNNFLVAIFGNYIVSYQLVPKYFASNY